MSGEKITAHYIIGRRSTLMKTDCLADDPLLASYGRCQRS